MTERIEQQELRELLGALCNEDVTASQHERLCELLTTDPQARQEYYEYCEIHLKLAQWANAETHSQPLSQLKEELDRMLPDRSVVAAGKVHSWMQMLFAIAATAAITLFFRQITLQDEHVGNKEQTAVETSEPGTQGLVKKQSATYIATLARSSDCVWEGGHRPRFDGQRLLSQELRLKQGTAEFRLETGVLLVMEGPSTMTIDSSRSATLEHGRVVLHGDEMAEEFALHTPHAVLFDEGTEYGAIVEPSRATEVHVFEGRVRVEPVSLSPNAIHTQEVLSSGTASRLDDRGSQVVPLAGDKFVRRIPTSDLPRIPSESDLLTEENFAYPGPDLGNADGGKGWEAPWRLGIEEYGPTKSQIFPGESLSTTAFDRRAAGGYFLQNGKGKAVRPLSTSLRMDADAIYYVSFMLNKSRESPRGVTQYGSVSLRSSDPNQFSDNKILFGMSSENYIIMTHNDHQVLSAPQLFKDETYFYVAKIVAGKTVPDQVLLRVYSPYERVDDSEPLSWNCVSRPQHDSTDYSNLFIYVGGDAEFKVDDIRIGSTWKSVTSLE